MPAEPRQTGGLRLHLVRHGQTRYNVERRMQGWCDSPLTGPGMSGVRVAAERLRDVSLVGAWASPSGRTMTTAAEILRHHSGLSVRADDGLRELFFGEAEARPENEVFAGRDVRQVFSGLMTSSAGLFPGGESGMELVTRVAGALRRLERAHPSGDVLVVSHGVTLVVLIALTTSGAVSERLVPLENASITTIERTDGAWQIGAGATP